MDSYDLKKLSVMIFYNHYNYYADKGQKKKFFDNMFSEAIMDRFFPIRYTGQMDVSKFNTIPKGIADKIAKENKLLYVKILRSLQWYINNWHTEVRTDWIDKLQLPYLKGRHSHHFSVLVQFRSIYANSFEEFEGLVKHLLKCHKGYNDMLAQYKEEGDVVDSPFSKFVVEEELVE